MKQVEEQKREPLEDLNNEAVAEEIENDQEGDTEETMEPRKEKEDKVEDASQDKENIVAEEVSEENTEEAEETVGEKKSIFKKKEKKNKKDEQIEELTDRLKRQMAEFDNFRKRTEKEKSQMYEIGAKNVVEKMLPIVDNFERGLSAVPEEERENPFYEGIDMIYKQLMTTLEEIGVKPIESVGVEFNPDYHNAVMHIEDEEVGENIVVEEFQKGYTYRDNVVRHSMVKVAN